MRGRLLKRISEERNFILGVALFIFVVLYKIVVFTSKESDVRSCLTAIFGYVGLENENRLVINFSAWIMTQLMFLFMYGEYYKREIITNSSIVLVRASSRLNILNKHIIILIKESMRLATFELAITLIFSVIVGRHIEINMLLILEILNIYLYIILVMLLINGLSLYMKTTYSVFVTIMIEMVQVYLLIKGFELARLLPVYGILYERIGNRISEAYYMVLNNAVWIGIIIVFTAFVFKKKKDFI